MLQKLENIQNISKEAPDKIKNGQCQLSRIDKKRKHRKYAIILILL